MKAKLINEGEISNLLKPKSEEDLIEELFKLPIDKLNDMLIDYVWKGSYNMTHLLIKAGADVNCTRLEHFTPLMYAANNGHKQIAYLLIKNGADLNKKDSHGNTALSFASKRMRADIVKLLSKHNKK